MMKRSTLSMILASLALTACMTDVGGDTDGSSSSNGNGNGNGHGDGNGNGNGNGDGNGNGGGEGGTATPSDVAALISGAECEGAHECKASFPSDFGATFAEVFGNSVDQCYELNDAYWGVDQVDAAVSGGTIQFNQEAADECVAGMVSAPVCSMFFDQGPGVPEACWGAFAGTVATGGACQISFECSDGYCEGGKCAAGN